MGVSCHFTLSNKVRFGKYVKTLIQIDDHLSITNRNRVCIAKLPVIVKTRYVYFLGLFC